MAYILKPDGETQQIDRPDEFDIEAMLGGPMALEFGRDNTMIFVREDAEDIGMPLNAYASKECAKWSGMVFGAAVIGTEAEFIGQADPYNP